MKLLSLFVEIKKTISLLFKNHPDLDSEDEKVVLELISMLVQVASVAKNTVPEKTKQERQKQIASIRGEFDGLKNKIEDTLSEIKLKFGCNCEKAVIIDKINIALSEECYEFIEPIKKPFYE